ncbi:SDR family oxidoreductase [Pseudonocardia sp. CA-107938]|uniref:SDR family oxidoreductase n=1 Tax=Pseudonocardia sp. CA-107938 TaxID=3240021 RepID=UPI003D8DB45B
MAHRRPRGRARGAAPPPRRLTVLVTGATGNTGRPLVDELLRRGTGVRAMVRPGTDPARLPPGVELVEADLDDAAAVGAALKGVDRAYLVTRSSERAEAQQLQFVELAAAAGVSHLVKLSQYAASADSPVRFLRYHAAVEQRVRELGIPFTFLRPNLFLQAFLDFGPIVQGMGVLPAPIGAARVSVVDVRDIVAVAATALTEPGHGGATYTITGPAAVTHAEIAAAISAATGQEITFADLPPAVFEEQLRGVLPPWQLAGLLEDYAHYARGEAAEVSPDVAAVTGRPARPMEVFFAEHAAAFTR